MNEKEPFLPGLEPDEENIEQVNRVDVTDQAKPTTDSEAFLVLDNDVTKKTKQEKAKEEWDAIVDACANCDNYGEACPMHMRIKPR